MTHHRTFESVEIGETVELTKGPLTTVHLMRWSAAMENWHKIHYDAPFTIEHEKLPGLLISGSLKQQFIMQLLKNWAGRTGWVAKASFQFRAMNLVGETLTAWAKIVDLQRCESFGLVRFEIGIRNEDGKESTPGTATVALPYADGAPVPCPFLPQEPIG
jgi:hydroxyacyl-ACP dehydratase HTD2-like protein with hotdog domain